MPGPKVLTERRDHTLLDRYERLVDLPLLVLALAIIPLLVFPLILDLNSAIDRAFLATDWIIWGVFAMDLAVRVYLTERRIAYLTSHWFDVLIVAIPFLRPLRVLRSARALRLLRLARITSFGTRAFITARTLGQRYGLTYVLVLAVFIVFAAASVVFAFERTGDGSIDDFGTALWWAMTTITTVGYGDAVPVTPEGRGIAVFLMIVGISLFGFLTASIAAFLVEQGQDERKATIDDVLTKLDALQHQIEDLRKDLQTLP